MVKYELLNHARDNFFSIIDLSAEAVSVQFNSSLELLRSDMLNIGCLFKPSDLYGFGDLKFDDPNEAKKLAKVCVKRYLYEKAFKYKYFR